MISRFSWKSLAFLIGYELNYSCRVFILGQECTTTPSSIPIFFKSTFSSTSSLPRNIKRTSWWIIGKNLLFTASRKYLTEEFL